jgi:hypothetical protein
MRKLPRAISTHIVRSAAVLYVAIVLVCLVYFVPWWRVRGHTSGDWLSLLGLALGVVATFQIVVFVVDRMRRPSVMLYAQIYRTGCAAESDGIPRRWSRSVLQSVEVRALDPGPLVRMNAVINNKGTARVEGGLFNICVTLKDHELILPGDTNLRQLAEPQWCVELDELTATRVACLLAFMERDFAPDHAIVVPFDVRFPGPGRWPVYLCLDGEPNHHRKTRVWVTTWENP